METECTLTNPTWGSACHAWRTSCTPPEHAATSHWFLVLLVNMVLTMLCLLQVAKSTQVTISGFDKCAVGERRCNGGEKLWPGPAGAARPAAGQAAAAIVWPHAAWPALCKPLLAWVA